MVFLNCNNVTISNKLNDGDICSLNCDEYDYSNNKYNVFINGMISSNENAINQLKELSVNDANNILIYNDSSFNINQNFFNKSKSFFIDVYHSILGKFSNNLGVKSEKSVESIIKFLRNTLKTNSKVTINAYSQGVIILKNALTILNKEFSNDEWNTLKNNVQIKLYGSPCGVFSDDLKITEYKSTFDFVSLFKGLNIKNNNYNLEILDTFGHSFDSYRVGLKNIK